MNKVWDIIIEISSKIIIYFYISEKCGILQKCFSKRSYLSQRNGVVMEAFAMLSIAFFLMILLLLWEYKYIQRIFRFILYKWIYPNKEPRETETMGVRQERNNVVNMKKQLKKKIRKSFTFDLFLLNYFKHLILNLFQPKIRNKLKHIYLHIIYPNDTTRNL